MKLMSFGLTKKQFRARTKTVTRRLGWENLKPGELVCGCEKVMGRRRGEELIRMGVVRIVSNRREPLRRMTDDVDYGFEEVVKEGFGDIPALCWPSTWVPWFCSTHKGCRPETVVSRIEFEYVDGIAPDVPTT